MSWRFPLRFSRCRWVWPEEAISGAVPKSNAKEALERILEISPTSPRILAAMNDVSVNVVFFGGADFDRPPPLGDTDRSRYVKLTTLEEAQGREMHKWINQMGRVTGWE